MKKLTLTLLPDNLGVCRLDIKTPLQELPRPGRGFYSVTITSEEISLVCRDDIIPASYSSEKPFRIYKVEGPLDFGLTGILAALLKPLAEAGIPVFTISTYDTDYIMVKCENLDRAHAALNKVAVLK
jgi:hypothetical protein